MTQRATDSDPAAPADQVGRRLLHSREHRLADLLLQLFTDNKSALRLVEAHDELRAIAPGLPATTVPRDEFTFDLARLVHRYGLEHSLFSILISVRPKCRDRIGEVAALFDARVPVLEPPSLSARAEAPRSSRALTGIAVALVVATGFAAGASAVWPTPEAPIARPPPAHRPSDPAGRERDVAAPASDEVCEQKETDTGGMCDPPPSANPRPDPSSKQRVRRKADHPVVETIELEMVSRKSGKSWIEEVPKEQQAAKAAKEIFHKSMMENAPSSREYLDDDEFGLCAESEECYGTQAVGDIFKSGDRALIQRKTKGDGYQRDASQSRVLPAAESSPGGLGAR